jgi:hypothetical protein
MKCIAKFTCPTTSKVTLSGFSVNELWQKTVKIANCPVCRRRHRLSVRSLHKWWATDEQLQALQDSVTRPGSLNGSLILADGPQIPSPDAVRITATEGVAVQWLLQRLRPHRLVDASLRVEVIQTDRVVDLAAGEADIAIRFGFSPAPGLVGSKIGRFGMSVMAAAPYRERFGTPRTITDLKHHRIIDHSTLHKVGAMRPWTRAIRGCAIAWSSASTWEVLELVKEGEGLSVFPDYISEKHHLFKTPVELNITREVWVVAREAALSRPHVAAVIDCLCPQGSENEEEWFKPAAVLPARPIASA